MLPPVSPRVIFINLISPLNQTRRFDRGLVSWAQEQTSGPGHTGTVAIDIREGIPSSMGYR